MKQTCRQTMLGFSAKSCRLIIALVLALPPDVRAQADSTEAVPPPSAPPRFSSAELEKLAAPIALHPDTLLAIILPAATLPVEIVQAARFVRNTNNFPELDNQSWDDSVKAVARVPALIQQMDNDLSWTTDLGNAYLDQYEELLSTIQSLRVKARKNGALQDSPQQIVVVTNSVTEKTVEQKVVFVTNTVVQIQPANPQVIYVPAYPPTVYYAVPPPRGPAPPPPMVTFGAGIAVGVIIANNYHPRPPYWYHPRPPGYVVRPPPHHHGRPPVYHAPPPAYRGSPPAPRPPGHAPYPATRPSGGHPPGGGPRPSDDAFSRPPRNGPSTSDASSRGSSSRGGGGAARPAPGGGRR